jgi:hypothetical protein
MSEEITVTSQGIMDMFKLADKEFIEKVMALSKLIKIEKGDGVTRVILEFADPQPPRR